MGELFDNFSKTMQTTDYRKKMACLRELQTQCDDPKESADAILNIFDECYLLILKSYEDRYDGVRSLAIELVTGFIKRLPPNDFHVANIVQTIKQRMGSPELIEDMEEVRLLLIQQLNALIKQYITTGNAAYLAEHHSDMAAILNQALRDEFAAVKKESCFCVTALASSAGQFGFQLYAEILVKPIYSILGHKHTACRVAAVEALGQCALHLDASGESLQRLLMEVTPLLMNFSPMVNLECGKMGAMLMLKLRDRYSYFDRIIPLVLGCLTHSSPIVMESIRPLWLQCGKQYYNENELELNKQELSDPIAENYPEHVERPTIGCRALVQRCLRLLPVITRETSDWNDGVRLNSLKLLQQFVLHAEAKMTAKFFEIYPEVAQACRATSKDVAKEAYAVCDLMGRLLKYGDWAEHGFEGLCRHPDIGYVKCFYYMFKSSVGVPREHIQRLSETLVDPDFSQSLKPEMQNYILKMVEDLIKKSDTLQTATGLDSHEAFEEIYKNLYIATVKVMALSLAVAGVDEGANHTALAELAERLDCGIGDLHDEYMNYALGYVNNLDADLESRSEPILLLHGLLALGGLRKRCLSMLQEKLLLVFEYCSDEAKVKVFSGMSIAMLKWHETIDGDLTERTMLLSDFNEKIVKPHLMWNAGANAEAMRSLAAAALCSMAQGAPAEAPVVLPTVAEYMTSLLEDRSAATRQYAVRALFNFGPIPMQHVKAIAYGVLQRFNDPSINIRKHAVKVIPKLQPAINLNQSDDNDPEAERTHKFELDVWRTFIQKVADMLYLHYDGPDQSLKVDIKETIKELGEEFADIMKERYDLTLAGTYAASTELICLKDELSFLK